MAFVVGTFALIVGIIFGLYWLFVLRLETADEAALRTRITKGTSTIKTNKALLKPPERMSNLGAKFRSPPVKAGRGCRSASTPSRSSSPE